MKKNETIINIMPAVLISSFSPSPIVFFRSEILKEMAILTSEKQSNAVVKIFSAVNAFSISIKYEENIINNCPNTNKGIKKKMNFVQTYLFGVVGEVFIIHKALPSEIIAG